MRCPRCKDDVDRCDTGTGKLDYILACVACSWQVAVAKLKEYLERWGKTS
jgi:hypothetical protein